MNVKLYVAVAVIVGLAGCAKRPDAIMPVNIPMAAYSNLSCVGLAQELVKERGRLAGLSNQQNQAATGDTVGVLYLGIPAASVFGLDTGGQVALSKGKVNAIESARRTKGCR